MKKITLVLAVLMLAAPAFGDTVTITAAQVGTTKEVTITYVAPGKLPRAFALDITVDNSQTIDDVTNFARGECDVPDKAKGYGIFPASFAREIDADDPCWADVNYTPVADVNDLVGDTQGGIGTSGVTIEMGSLYEGPNKPASAGTLCSVWVSGDCNVGFALNVGRAGIVLEDGNDANTPPNSVVLIGCHVTTAVVCTVPDVVGDSNDLAQLDIIAAGFTIGNITTECNDVIADGNVISTDPAAGATPVCGSPVALVVSTGPCAVVCDCPGDVSSIAAAGVPDNKVSMADSSYITDLVNAFGTGRPLAIPSTDTVNFVLCGDVSSIAAAGVPDGKVSMADSSYITDLVNAFGTGRPLSIPCP